MNKIYLVEFDNDENYSDSENYTVGVFESFEKAENYCILNGYEKTETEGLYKKKRKDWFAKYTYLIINEVAINEIICEAE